MQAAQSDCFFVKVQITGKPTTPVPLSQCGAVATGFELSADGLTWHAVPSIEVLHRTWIVLFPPKTFDVTAESLKVRYLFADWPVPVVYNSESFLGHHGELPTPPFEMDVQLTLK